VSFGGTTRPVGRNDFMSFALGTLRILPVEDEHLIRLVAGYFLKDEGFEVEEASSGDEAVLRLVGPEFSMYCSPMSKCRAKWMASTLRPTPAASIRRLFSSSCPGLHPSSAIVSRISIPPPFSFPNPTRYLRLSERSDAWQRNNQYSPIWEGSSLSQVTYSPEGSKIMS
jgi:hypothetical protein